APRGRARRAPARSRWAITRCDVSRLGAARRRRTRPREPRAPAHRGIGVPVEGRRRPAWAEVDLVALAHNAASLRDLVAPALLCAVVKADGYGHGARSVARG